MTSYDRRARDLSLSPCIQTQNSCHDQQHGMRCWSQQATNERQDWSHVSQRWRNDLKRQQEWWCKLKLLKGWEQQGKRRPAPEHRDSAITALLKVMIAGEVKMQVQNALGAVPDIMKEVAKQI